MVWSRHACAAPWVRGTCCAVLVSCPTTSRLQSRTPGAPVAVWCVTGIFSWRHQPCRRQRPPPSIIGRQDMSSHVHTAPLVTGVSLPWVCGCETIYRLSRDRTSATDIQTTTENISVRDQLPTAHRECLLVWALKILLLTYLLTYLLIGETGHRWNGVLTAAPLLWTSSLLCGFILFINQSYLLQCSPEPLAGIKRTYF